MNSKSIFPNNVRDVLARTSRKNETKAEIKAEKKIEMYMIFLL